MKRISFLILFCCFNSVLAKEAILSTVTNEEEKSIYNLVVETDRDDRVIKNVYRDELLSGKLVERRKLDLQAINSTGMVVKEDLARGLVIIKLISSNFDFERGGMVTLDTLLNGVTGSRKEYEFEITKSRTGFVLLKDRTVVKSMHMVSNRLPVVGSVGIKDVKVNQLTE